MGGELAESGFKQKQSGFRIYALNPRLGCFSINKISVSCTIVFTVVLFKNVTSIRSSLESVQGETKFPDFALYSLV